MSLIARRYFRTLPLKPKSTEKWQTLDTGEQFAIRQPNSHIPLDLPYPAQQGIVVPASATQKPQSRKFSDLSPKELHEIRAKRLRSSQTALAKEYGTSRMAIAAAGFGSNPDGRAKRKAFQGQKDAEFERQKLKWSPAKMVTHEVKLQKRQLW